MGKQKMANRGFLLCATHFILTLEEIKIQARVCSCVEASEEDSIDLVHLLLCCSLIIQEAERQRVHSHPLCFALLSNVSLCVHAAQFAS